MQRVVFWVPRFLSVILLAGLLGAPAVSQCQGTPGTHGIPRLAIDRVTPGSVVDLDIYRGRPSSYYLLLIAAGGAQVPTPIGTLCVNPALPLFLGAGFLDANGEDTLSIPLPSVPGLLNLPIHAQAAILDSANPTGYALTNAVATRVTPPHGIVSGWNRTTGGHIMRVDMLTGAVLDTVQAGGRPLSCSVFDRSGRYLIAGADNGYVHLVDYGVSPPTVQGLLLGSGHQINGVAVTRDGRFCYASAYGNPSGSISRTWVLDADPLNPTFFSVIGTVTGYPAGHNEAQNTKAAPDQPWVCNAVFGFGSGQAQVSKVDANPHSVGFNTMVGTVNLTGGWAANLAIRPGNEYAYVTLFSLGGQAKVPVIDTTTMTCVDQDPVVPGCQYLGGELSGPATPLGNNPLGVDCDDSGKSLFVVDTISRTTPQVYQVRRVNIDPASSQYHQVVQVYNLPITSQPYQCGVSPDGSRLLVSYNSSPNATLFDAVSGQVMVHYNLGFNAYWAAVK